MATATRRRFSVRGPAVACLGLAVLAGCDRVSLPGLGGGQRPEAQAGASAPISPTARPGDTAPTDGPLQTAPLAQTGGGTVLERTVASLGDPGQPGLWVKTTTVKAPVQGVARALSNGAELPVTLLPLVGQDGAGAQISLMAMQGLGLSLGDLPELELRLR